MKKTTFISIIFLGIILAPISSNAQENDINLDLLFDKWTIIQDGSYEKELVVKKSKGNSIYSYDFSTGMDSIIYQDKILERRIGYFCIPTPRARREEEVWSLDSEKSMLRYDIYFDSITNKKPADYSIIYKIISLDKNYLKLRLEKELFEGVE